jgi:hypothetical protein
VLVHRQELHQLLVHRTLSQRIQQQIEHLPGAAGRSISFESCSATPSLALISSVLLLQNSVCQSHNPG